MKDQKQKQISEYSFSYSYDCLPFNKRVEVKRKIQDIFYVFTDSQFSNILHGKIKPKPYCKMAVENLFLQYGITIEWGKSTTEIMQMQ